jgi:transcriptional regulator of acetoin/glycerol metabolism
MNTLLGFTWPGTLREPQYCVERMVAMNSGPLLQTGDLSSALQTYLETGRGGVLSVAAVANANGASRPAAPQSGIIPLTEMEKHAILNALEYTKGDRVMAACLLGIARTTLYRKLKEYRLVS